MKRLAPLMLVLVLVAGLVVVDRLSVRAADAPYAAVTDERLRNAATDDGWLMYLRSYNSQAHAPWKQINTTNVAQLKPVFTHDVSLPEGFEAPPMVNGRTMIVTTPLDHVYALDAVTGEKQWEYDYPLDRKQLRTVCCDMVNRGVALYGDNAYMATLDNHVVALDARSGKLLWNKQIYPLPGDGYAMTLAPLAVEGKIIVGESGGEFGIRGFIVALDPANGNEIWRRYTIPAPNEPGGDTWGPGQYEHGGGGAWLTGSYDPDSRTLYWGVGNAGPWLWSQRSGRNLYTCSTMALDIDTGKVKWAFQETPNDTWDYDATNTPVLADITVDGKPRKVYFTGGRNGWFYTVDRTNGDLIAMKPTTKVTSVTGYDRAHRIGITDNSKRPKLGGPPVFTCPAFFGGTNWWPSSYDPNTGLAFVSVMHTCMKLSAVKPEKFQPGAQYVDENFEVEHVPGDDHWGEIQAIDVATGQKKWGMETKLPWNDATLSTDGGLVFSGTPDGHFYAFEARTGKILWDFKTRSGIIGVPISYRVDGKQYIAVQSGWGGVSPFYGGKNMVPLFRNIPLGGRLYVFALPDNTGSSS